MMTSSARRLTVLCSTVALLLGGCAAERLQREGMELIGSGKPEEGLRKLDEASAIEPTNASYRANLLRQRAEITAALLERADAERAANHDQTARELYARALRIAPMDRGARAGLDALERAQRHAIGRAHV